MRHPNLFLVGAPRCGTTSMYHYLDVHPQIYMSPVKAPHFFGSDLVDPEFTRDPGAYAALFDEARDEPVIGECSVWYLYSQRAAAEIHAASPEARILIMLRDPVEMMVSLHARHVDAGFEHGENLAEVLARRNGSGARHNSVPSSFRQHLDYRDVARLAPQVARYLDRFGREHVHIVPFDDLIRDPAATYRAIMEFLGVDPDVAPVFRQHNRRRRQRFELLKRLGDAIGDKATGARGTTSQRIRHRLGQGVHRLNLAPAKSSLPPALRQRLRAECRDDILRLASLIDRDLSHWIERD